MSNSNITGNSNIVIQDVNESTITVNVNGEVQEIKNQLSELKELLKSSNNTNITYENKVYNIEHINEANFGMVTSHKVFNGLLTRDLMKLLSDKPKPGNFLSSLPPRRPRKPGKKRIPERCTVNPCRKFCMGNWLGIAPFVCPEQRP